MAEDTRRPDHFAHLKHAPDAPLPEAHDPVVTPDVVEHLERLFAPTLLPLGSGMDGAVDLAIHVARQLGEQRVISAIRQLIRGA